MWLPDKQQVDAAVIRLIGSSTDPIQRQCALAAAWELHQRPPRTSSLMQTPLHRSNHQQARCT
jgi:hypothetical protein